MIGKRIQQLRQERGLSLSELADRAGIAKSYLSAIERDIQGNPSIQVIEKLCTVLEISMSGLLEAESNAEGDAPPVLDPEWLQIVREAMESGISKSQFKDFLEFQKWRLHNKDENNG